MGGVVSAVRGVSARRGPWCLRCRDAVVSEMPVGGEVRGVRRGVGGRGVCGARGWGRAWAGGAEWTVVSAVPVGAGVPAVAARTACGGLDGNVRDTAAS
ncbi:hypothetical protein GCM10010168_27350 [Actinoplanes ianthinogenes]|uniref:Uncharacterized protein n=1 Tax=Actinoplanes ianthinogenes TaxID=122358 RepID=A0ABM7LKW9_9ACTN|nr:hypothetical protein Aiant_05320 [Actinoplanes ianthinogenes]GGR08737.1 hypothetical protein GCM10010168_27350 [Actinoplanes ianthinogenes]